MSIVISTYWLIIGFIATWQIHEPGLIDSNTINGNELPTSQTLIDTCGVPVSKDYTYIIGNKPVTLKNGISEIELAPGSASKSIIRCLNYEAIADLNGDGRKDVAFLLTRSTGGSGTFYYVAVILSAAKGYHGINAVSIGDRIIVKSIETKGGTIVVNYAERKKGEPMSAEPTVGVSKHLQLSGGKLIEANITAKIKDRTWKWTKTTMNNGENIIPKKSDAFVIHFNEDGTLNGKTDCNSYFGTYQLNGNKLSFGPFGSTKKFCLDSQELIFMQSLSEVESCFITKEGNLVLRLKSDSGSMLFN